ncbi:MAG: tail fiber protein [bacterium]
MAEPFIGEIRLVGFDFAPRGWADCNGQLLPIAQFAPLFSIIGTTYGGDGRQTFALPDLRGRLPVGLGRSLQGDEIRWGQSVGAETVTLQVAELPSHGHPLPASSATGESPNPAGAVPARTRSPRYAGTGTAVALADAVVAEAGGSQPHDNIGPVAVLKFIIAHQGIFPPRQ